MVNENTKTLKELEMELLQKKASKSDIESDITTLTAQQQEVKSQCVINQSYIDALSEEIIKLRLNKQKYDACKQEVDLFLEQLQEIGKSRKKLKKIAITLDADQDAFDTLGDRITEQQAQLQKNYAMQITAASGSRAEIGKLKEKLLKKQGLFETKAKYSKKQNNILHMIKQLESDLKTADSAVVKLNIEYQRYGVLLKQFNDTGLHSSTRCWEMTCGSLAEFQSKLSKIDKPSDEINKKLVESRRLLIAQNLRQEAVTKLALNIENKSYKKDDLEKEIHTLEEEIKVKKLKPETTKLKKRRKQRSSEVVEQPSSLKSSFKPPKEQIYKEILAPLAQEGVGLNGADRQLIKNIPEKLFQDPALNVCNKLEEMQQRYQHNDGLGTKIARFLNHISGGMLFSETVEKANETQQSSVNLCTQISACKKKLELEVSTKKLTFNETPQPTVSMWEAVDRLHVPHLSSDDVKLPPTRVEQLKEERKKSNPVPKNNR